MLSVLAVCEIFGRIPRVMVLRQSTNYFSKCFFVFFVVVETHKLMPTKDLPTNLVKQKKNKG